MKRIHYTVFPKASSKFISPENLYAKMFGKFSRPRHEVYMSTPLTSGGARRLSKTLEKQRISLATIISLNGHFAHAISQEINVSFQKASVTLPHMIGFRKDWGELEYMKFWMYYISGLKLSHVKKFSNLLKNCNIIDRNVFNDYRKPKEQRAQEYQRLLNYFAGFLRMNRKFVNPISRIYMLPDHSLSLGCCFEKKLAVSLGVCVKEIFLDSSHPEFTDKIAQFAPWLLFRGLDVSLPIADYNSGKLVLYE